MAVALPGVLVGVTGVSVPIVIVETGSTTLVEFGCTCGDDVAMGACVAMDVCVAMGVGAEVGSGVGIGAEVGSGVGVGGQKSKIHPELIAWATVTPVIPLNVDSKSA